MSVLPTVTGTYRHSLFSLDRTNFVQDILSRKTLEQYLLLVRREWIHSNTLWSNHRELWAENGDALSRIYAGTGAINTSFTRSGKRTLAGEHFLMMTIYEFLRDFLKVSSLTPRRAYHGHISTTFRTKENR